MDGDAKKLRRFRARCLLCGCLSSCTRKRIKFASLSLVHATSYDKIAHAHGHVQRGSRGVVPPPWIFIHGTKIVDKRLNSAMFWSFFVIFRPFFQLLPSERGLTVLFSVIFLLFFGLFSVAPSPEIFLPTILHMPMAHRT